MIEYPFHSLISCKSGEATCGLCCINLYKGTLVNPEQFHQLQNSGSLNHSLKASHPKVSMTSFLCLKSLVWWTQGRWPGREQILQKIWKIKTKSADCLHFSAICLQTSCSLTQQLSSQCVDSRHLGHQLAGCSSAVQSKDSWPVWWHLQQNLILARFRSLEALRVLRALKLPDCEACEGWSALFLPELSSEMWNVHFNYSSCF